MPIPPFEENGNLPLGIYYCTWAEFVDRFEITPQRKLLIQGLKKAMKHLQKAGCRTIYINGSFVTDKLYPKDFDACWELEGVDINYLKNNAPELLNFVNQRQAQKNKYKGEFFPSEMLADDGIITFLELFQIDKRKNRKGIIAIDLIREEIG